MILLDFLQFDWTTTDVIEFYIIMSIFVYKYEWVHKIFKFGIHK